MCAISWQKRKQLKGTSYRVKQKWRKEDVLKDKDDEDIVEVTDKDDNEIVEEDDDEYSGVVPFDETGKEDPNFSPGLDSINKPRSSHPIRRSSRFVVSLHYRVLVAPTSPFFS